jgi:hypothetical protein
LYLLIDLGGKDGFGVTVQVGRSIFDGGLIPDGFISDIFNYCLVYALLNITEITNHLF